MLLLGAVGLLVVLALYMMLKPRKTVGLGSVPTKQFFSALFDMRQTHETMLKIHQRYGENLAVESVFGTMVMLSGVSAMNSVFRDRATFPMPPSFRQALNKESGHTMFTSEGDEWKHRHKTLQPLLHRKTFTHHQEIMKDRIKTFLSKLPTNPNEAFNVAEPMYYLTTDVIGASAFGTNFHCLEDPHKAYPGDNGIALPILEASHRTFEALGLRARLRESWLWKLPLATFRRELEGMTVLRNMFHSAMEENAAHEASDADHTNLVALLMAARNRDMEAEGKHTYSDSDTFGECFSVFNAGYDTTAATATFLVNYLAIDRRAQQLCREEADRVIAESGSLGVDEPLPYIDACITETLRLRPVAPFLLREATTDAVIDDTIRVPKGATLFLNLYAAHRNPTFAEPEHFCPERWLPNGDMDAATRDNPDHKILAFGQGIRQCFGRRFADMELRSLVFALVRHCEWSPAPDRPAMRVDLKLGLQAVNKELWLSVRPRTDVAGPVL